ncbi:MAG: adenylate/guanylate cyclase domain-containing protein [Caldilineales bacterium]|nr:adenylate/guanylate cyclase domain-containing protein [Caldilineales bacterium]
MHTIPDRFRRRIETIGIAPGDGDDLRLQKTSLVASSLMFSAAGAAWGLTYFALGNPLAGAIPFSYAVVSMLSLAVFAYSKRYDFFRSSQLLLVLVLPFLLMLVLGGFVNSSAVILWSILCPLGALVFAGRLSAPVWLVGYLALLVLSGVLQGRPGAYSPLPGTVITAFFVLNLGAVSTIVFVLLGYFIGQQTGLLRQLRREQDKTRRLLLNVLPQEIADKLKEEEGRVQTTHAQSFAAISVLFADVVGFTSLSVRLSPAAMVDLLNDIYSYFDTLVVEYGVEKIRTIGDNYMVVAGAPQTRPDHAAAIADLALAMRGFIDHTPAYRELGLSFRIGVNSGPAIGAVIGKTKFHYDVWGDAVNIASRMESHGVPGKIQIAGPTYDLLERDFICTPRGPIEVKGKGVMETWFLEGRKGTINNQQSTING